MIETGSLRKVGITNPPKPVQSVTQRELAVAAGISESYLSHILAGRRRPTLPVGARVARVLGLSLDQLYEKIEAGT